MPGGARIAAGMAFAIVTQAFVVAGTQVGPVLAPLAAGEIGADPRLVGFYSTLVLGTALVVSAICAALVARLGAPRSVVAAVALAAAGALALASSSLAGAVLSAILVGAAYGPINPATARLVSSIAPPRHHALLFSLKQTSVALGGAMAGAILPVVATSVGWRWTALLFAAAAAVMAPAAALAGRAIREPEGARPVASRRGLLRPLGAAIADRRIRQMGAVIFTLSVAQFGLMSLYVTILWDQAGQEPAVAGAMLSAGFLASVPARLLWGWLADRSSSQAVLSGLALATAACLVVVALLGRGTPSWAILAVSILLGCAPLGWAGLALSQMARLGATLPSRSGIIDSTSGMMVFAYGGGLAGPAFLSASAAVSGSYRPGLFLIAAAVVAAAWTSPSGRESAAHS